MIKNKFSKYVAPGGVSLLFLAEGCCCSSSFLFIKRRKRLLVLSLIRSKLRYRILGNQKKKRNKRKCSGRRKVTFSEYRRSIITPCELHSRLKTTCSQRQHADGQLPSLDPLNDFTSTTDEDRGASPKRGTAARELTDSVAPQYINRSSPRFSAFASGKILRGDAASRRESCWQPSIPPCSSFLTESEVTDAPVVELDVVADARHSEELSGRQYSLTQRAPLLPPNKEIRTTHPRTPNGTRKMHPTFASCQLRREGCFPGPCKEISNVHCRGESLHCLSSVTGP